MNNPGGDQQGAPISPMRSLEHIRSTSPGPPPPPEYTLERFLGTIGLPKPDSVVELLQENEILDMATLKLMGLSDYESVGIKLGSRLKIIAALKKLRDAYTTDSLPPGPISPTTTNLV
eukprot:m.103210 g.103210  ORF g.103210 m.103210 type:complete len:118 (-) comp27481_c1_seq1:260-613(-)